jgi:hypothetical protein
MESVRIHRPLTVIEADTFGTLGPQACLSAPGETPETHQHASGSHAHEVRPQEGSGPNDGAGIASDLSRDPAAPKSSGILMSLPGARAVADLPASDCSDMPPSLARLLDEQCDSILVLADHIPAEIRARLMRREERRQLREQLFARLLYVSRQLADSRMSEVFDHDFHGYALVSKCAECSAKLVPGQSEIQHASSCRVGAVIEVILALVAAAEFSASPSSAIALQDAAAQEGGAL